MYAISENEVYSFLTLEDKKGTSNFMGFLFCFKSLFLRHVIFVKVDNNNGNRNHWQLYVIIRLKTVNILKLSV